MNILIAVDLDNQQKHNSHFVNILKTRDASLLFFKTHLIRIKQVMSEASQVMLIDVDKVN